MNLKVVDVKMGGFADADEMSDFLELKGYNNLFIWGYAFVEEGSKIKVYDVSKNDFVAEINNSYYAIAVYMESVMDIEDILAEDIKVFEVE